MDEAMNCIYCHSSLSEKQSSIEHVFPYAIGCRLTMRGICKSCNDKIGANVDCLLTEDYLIRAVRFGLRIPNRSGDIPSPLHNGELLGRSGIKASFSATKSSCEGILRIEPSVTSTTEPGRSKTSEVWGDPKDVEDISRKMIARAASRNQNAEVNDLGTETLRSPTLINKGKTSPERLLLPLLKIAYELGVLWLGKDYIVHPTGETLSNAVVTGRDEGVSWEISQFSPFSNFEEWQIPSYFHAGSLQLKEGKLFAAIRIFNFYEACILLNDTDMGFREEDCSWVVLDPVGRTFEVGSGPRPLGMIQDTSNSSITVEGINESIFKIITNYRGLETHSIHAEFPI